MPPKLIPIKKNAEQNYRYKMPTFIVRKIQSGSKTVILNSLEVSRALNRSLESLYQWFSFKGGKVTMNKENGQLTLNGDRDVNDLTESLYDFINHFLLCPVCSNPETTFEKNPDKTLSFVCRACGRTSPLPVYNDNINSRMLDWFVNHTSIEKGSNKDITPSARKDTSDNRKAQGHEANAGEYLSVEELTKIMESLEPVQKVAATQQTNEEFLQFFETFVQKVQSDESDDSVFKFYTKVADEGAWNAKVRVKMLFAALLKPDEKDDSRDHVKDILQCLEKRRGLIIRFTPDEISQKTFLIHIVSFIDTFHPELRSSAPVIFHALYENELVEEATFESWAKGKSKNISRMLQATTEFFKWMRNAQLEPEPEKDEEPEPTPAEEKPEAKDEEEDIDGI